MSNPERLAPKRDLTSWQLDPLYLQGYQAYLARVRELRRLEKEERDRISSGVEDKKI